MKLLCLEVLLLLYPELLLARAGSSLQAKQLPGSRAEHDPQGFNRSGVHSPEANDCRIASSLKCYGNRHFVSLLRPRELKVKVDSVLILDFLWKQVVSSFKPSFRMISEEESPSMSTRVKRDRSPWLGQESGRRLLIGRLASMTATYWGQFQLYGRQLQLLVSRI